MYSDQQKQLVNQMEEAARQGNFLSSVIGSGADFANDSRVCLTSVLFVPAELGALIVKKIIEPLRAIEPEHYFYSPESMHLTIKNVQIISDPPTFTETDVRKVAVMFEETVPRYPAFSFSLEDVIQFPTSVSVMGYCDERLQGLVQALDNNLKKIGVPDNKKYFSDSIFFGNITVCRFLHEPGPVFIQKLAELRTAVIGQMLAKEITLVTCNSVCHANSLRTVGTYSLS